MKRLIPFLNKIIASGNEPDENGCWNYQGGKTAPGKKNTSAGGYGEFFIGGKMRYAHNLSYLLLVVIPSMGKNPQDFTDAEILKMLDAMKQNGKKEGSHTCHNRGCVNPLHQERESHAQNINRTAKITNEQVLEIRERWVKGSGTANPGNSRELAKEYGVTHRTISAIARGKYRKDVKNLSE